MPACSLFYLALFHFIEIQRGNDIFLVYFYFFCHFFVLNLFNFLLRDSKFEFKYIFKSWAITTITLLAPMFRRLCNFDILSRHCHERDKKKKGNCREQSFCSVCVVISVSVLVVVFLAVVATTIMITHSCLVFLFRLKPSLCTHPPPLLWDSGLNRAMRLHSYILLVCSAMAWLGTIGKHSVG